MALQSKDRFYHYDFVVTILWIGFILAISFMEAPLRFQAENITIHLALQIGKLVFHGLNYVEIAFAISIFGCQFANGRSTRSRRLYQMALTILVVQTLMLFLLLDPRTNAIIANEEVENAPYHLIYIALEFIKLFVLCVLTHSQIRDLKRLLMTIGKPE